MINQVGKVDPLGVRAVNALLTDAICGSAVYHSETASTNTLAINDLRSGPIDSTSLPRLYLADDQTGGRGRHGRSWSSTGGTLTFSLLVDHVSKSGEFSKLTSLAVGVAVAQAIEHTFAPLRVALKWPNDVYIDGGKVAGVLIETTPNDRCRAVIGVGVNVNHSPRLEDPEAAPVRALGEVSGRRVDRYEILGPLVDQIVSMIRPGPAGDSELLAGFRSRCLLTGRQIRFERGGQVVIGRCLGVTDGGELSIETEDGGIQNLSSGEARMVRTRH